MHAVNAEVPFPFMMPVKVVAPVPPFGTVTGVDRANWEEVAQVNPLPEEMTLLGVSKEGPLLVTPFKIIPVVPALVEDIVFASDQ